MSLNRVEQMKEVQQEALNLFKRKNADYGDSFATFGAIGVIVRMQDKINRLISVSNTNINCVKDESLRDTLIDLHNYSAMAIMLMDEKNESKFIPIKEEVTAELGQPKKTPQQDCVDAIEENGYFGC
jgi:hypothetical protein